MKKVALDHAPSESLYRDLKNIMAMGRSKK